MAKASGSNVTKPGLKDRSISDFFSPIPSPASSAHSARFAASSSPAPRAAMALTRGGSDTSLASASASKPKVVPSRMGAAGASTVASGSGASPASTKKSAVAPKKIVVQPPSSVKGKGKSVEHAMSEPSSEVETVVVRPKSRSPVPPTLAPVVPAPSGLSLVLKAAETSAPAAKPAPSPTKAAAPTPLENAMEVDDPLSSSQDVSSSLLLSHTSPTKAAALPASSFYSPPPSRVRRPVSPAPDASTSHAQAIDIAPSSPTAARSDPFALLSTPPRYSGPTYTRSLSGSPLSSLSASPVKPRTKFVGVVIDVAPNKRLPKTLGGSVGTIRRERSVTAAELDSEPRDPTSPVKPEPADEYDPYSMLGDLSDDDVVVSDSDVSDDDADLMALVAANRAKIVADKAAGQAIPELQALGSKSPEVRKSGRAVVPPRRGRDEQQPPPAQQAKAAQSSASKGKLGMVALQKDHEERMRKKAAMEATQRLLNTTDALDGSESEDSDDYMGGTEELTSERINSMVQVATDLAIEEDEYSRSPEKKAARDKAAMMASVLKSATGTGDGTPAPLEDAKERQAWRTDVRVSPLTAPTESDGWKGRIAQAIRDGLKQPDAFPLPVQLFSPVAGRGSPEDQTLVSEWLFSLLAHPSTPALVAERANQLLTRIVAHRALSTAHANSSPLLTSHDIFDQLKRLGVRPEVLDAPHPRLAIEMDVDPATPGPLSELVSSDDRRQCLGRMLRVVQNLAGASPRLLCGTDVASLTVCLVRLALDPTAAPLRSALERTLQSLLSTVPVADVRVRCEIIDELLAVFQSAGVRTKLEVVQALPHETKSSKILRKWLAWVLLANPTDAAELTAFSRPPPLADVAAFLDQNDPRGPFAISPDMDDVALFEHMMLLTIALSDHNDELFVPDGATARRNALLVQDVAGALHEMDRRIRTDVKNGNPARNKAKNVIMRLEHALTYQAQIVLGVDTLDLGEQGDDAPGRKKQRLDQGQTTLSFARVAAPLTQANLAQIA